MLNRLFALFLAPGRVQKHLRPLPPRGAVALVDDNVREVMFGVVRRQKVRRRFFVVYVECLVGGDQDAGIFLRVPR